MKHLLLGAILALGLQAQASTTDREAFSFDGVKTQDNFVLNAEKTHTEYRYETVDKTCYRQEFVGYVTRCETRYETVCHMERECRVINGVRQCWDRQVCRQYPRNYCYQEAQYRTVAYTCQETVAIPYQVKDFDVQATVKVVYGAVPANLRVNEPLVLDLSADQLVLRTLNAKSNVLIFVDKQSHEHLAGNLKTLDVTYTLNFLNAADVAGPLSAKPTNVKFSDVETLTWDTNLVSRPDLFTLNLVIKRVKAFGGDKNVANQTLPVTDYLLAHSGGKTRFATTLTQAGVSASDREKGSYKAEVTLRANLDVTKLLNPASLPSDLEVKGEGKFKLK